MSKEFLQRKTPTNDQMKEMQLVMSLKLHQSEILSDLPLDVAMEVLVRVWMSCQIEADKNSDEVIHL